MFNASDSVAGLSLIVIGIVYFVVRIVGKYIGALLGCLMTKKDKNVRNYLGLALIPQAGVAIGLATLASRTIGGNVGASLETIILASSVLYELIGPACAKLALNLSKSYSSPLEEVPSDQPIDLTQQQNQVEKLIEQIDKIRQTLPPPTIERENEQAFDEAAEEYYVANMRRLRH